MRKTTILALIAFAAICTLAPAKKYWDAPAGQGTSTVGTAGDYATLVAAAADFNTSAPLGNWTMEIISNITETATPCFAQYTNGNTVTIKPAATNPGVVTVTLPNNTGTGPEWSGNFIIGQKSAETVNIPPSVHGFTIDGDKDGGTPSRDLVITNGGTAAGTVIRVIGNSDGVVFKNLVVTGVSTSTSSRYGIEFVSLGWEGTPNYGLNPDNALVENCLITMTSGASSQGIATNTAYQTGHVNPIPTGYAASGHVYRNNTIAARTRGIFMNNSSGVTIEGNELTVNQIGSGYASYGIWHLGGGATSNYTQTIRNNRFLSLTHAITGSPGNYGMTAMDFSGAGSGTTNIRYDIYNNMVGGWNYTGLAPANVYYRGIRVANNVPTYNIYQNSIYMPDFANMTGQLATRCYGIAAEASPAYLNIKNNIVVMGEAGGACIYKSGASGVLNSDGNVLFTNGVGTTGRLQTTEYSTLAQWQAGSGGDANSVSQNPFPTWVSASDLHFASAPGAAWKAGVDVSGFSPAATDYDAANRDVVEPYFGADEPVAPDTTITVASAQGSPVPAVGVSNTTSGTLVNASVASPVSAGAGAQYSCLGYTGTGSAPSGGGNSVSFTITTPATLTWNWSPIQYQLTTVASPVAGGTISGGTDGAFYDTGTVLAPQANPNPGWFFTGWSGALSGTTNPESLTMDAAKSITATFVNADIATTPSSALNFGAISDNTSTTLNLTIGNLGDTDLVISSLVISGADGAAYYTTATLPLTILGGGSYVLPVRFFPTAVQTYNDATLTIGSNDVDEPSVAIDLDGSGVSGVADIDLSAASLAFGNVATNAPADLTVTINNIGLAGLSVNSLSISGPGAGAYSVVLTPATPFVVAGSGSQVVTVRFAPTAAANYLASLDIASNDPDEPTVSVSLSGDGVPPTSVDDWRMF